MANLHRVRLHGVVSPAELAGVEEHPQNLDVMLGRNAGDDDAMTNKPIPPSNE